MAVLDSDESDDDDVPRRRSLLLGSGDRAKPMPSICVSTPCGTTTRTDLLKTFAGAETESAGLSRRRSHLLQVPEAPDSDSSDCSGVSLYQQQRRVRLSLPCGDNNDNNDNNNSSNNNTGNVLTVPSADPMLANPEVRSNLYKRRSAVHGLSPNTNLSIGAVMLAAAEQACRAREEQVGAEQLHKSSLRRSMGLGLGFRMGLGLRHAVSGANGRSDANRGSDAPGATGPSSLFILSERNFLRRTTKFLIEWPYPVPRIPPKTIE